MTVAIPGRTAIPDPGGAAPTTAAPGVAIADGVASPVLASPTSAEVSGDEIRALLKPSDADGLDYGDGTGVVVVFDPATSDALSIGVDGVVAALAAGVVESGGEFVADLASPTTVELDGSDQWQAKFKTADANGLARGSSGVELVLDDQALTVGGSGVTLDRSWRTVDLTAPDATHNSGTLIDSIVSAGGGAYTITATNTGAIFDGPSDGMEQLRFALQDSAGNTIDYAGGKHIVEWRITIVSATAGDSMLVMGGIRTKPTTSDQGVVRLAGISTGTSAVDLSVCTALASNGTSTKASLYQVLGALLPTPIASGSFDIGTMTTTSLDSGGARIGPPSDTTTTSDATPGTCSEFHLCVGFDAAHTNTKAVTVKVEVRTIQVRP